EVVRLPEAYRLPVVLSYLEGKTNEEVAELLQWPVGTVKGRLARARELLRSRLGRRGVALSVAMLVTAPAHCRPCGGIVPTELVGPAVPRALSLKARAEAPGLPLSLPPPPPLPPSPPAP